MNALLNAIKSIFQEKPAMTIQSIDATSAKALVDKGAVLVDVRESAEHAAEHIANDMLLPLSRLTPVPVESGGNPVIFYCRSGARTMMSARNLDRIGGPTSYILAGGIEAWKAAGLPVVRR